jgi:hypothetical protein
MSIRWRWQHERRCSFCGAQVCITITNAGPLNIFERKSQILKISTSQTPLVPLSGPLLARSYSTASRSDRDPPTMPIDYYPCADLIFCMDKRGAIGKLLDCDPSE